LILMRIIEIVATRCQILRLKSLNSISALMSKIRKGGTGGLDQHGPGHF